MTTLCCLIAITFIEIHIPPQEITIKELNVFDLNKPYTIKGTISKQTLLPQGHLLITLEDQGHYLDSIMFSINKTLNKNKNISVTGRIKTYNGELQVIIEKIRYLN